MAEEQDNRLDFYACPHCSMQFELTDNQPISELAVCPRCNKEFRVPVVSNVVGEDERRRGMPLVVSSLCACIASIVGFAVGAFVAGAFAEPAPMPNPYYDGGLLVGGGRGLSPNAVPELNEYDNSSHRFDSKVDNVDQLSRQLETIGKEAEKSTDDFEVLDILNQNGRLTELQLLQQLRGAKLQRQLEAMQERGLIRINEQVQPPTYEAVSKR